jgi:hypothetical protein
VNVTVNLQGKGTSKGAMLGRSGTLRVGFTENASWRGIVRESCRHFRELQPDAELQLQPSGSLEQFEAIRSYRLDAGFVFNIPKTDPELELLPVAVRIELAALKGHPLTKLKKLRLRDLAEATFIWFPRPESPVRYDRLMHECLRGGLKSPRWFPSHTRVCAARRRAPQPNRLRHQQ